MFLIRLDGNKHIQDWFFNFCEIVTDCPLMLMFDGHLTHISALVMKKALKRNIIILKFPLHVTDVLYTLDVACFRPLKREWKRYLHKRISKCDTVTHVNSL